MSEEKIDGAAVQPTQPPTKKRGMKKWPIVVGVVVVVVIAAGAGFWVWHEQPSFCGAICHTPMDAYLETYEAELGEATTDKYGNEIEDSSAMMATLHAASDVTCIECHVPTLSEQISEGLNWVTGSYTFPLTERTLEELTEARGAEDDDEFCLNEDCHNLTRDDLIEATSDMERNPHLSQHGEISCGECHKGHTASVFYCTQCHDDCEVPDGWLTYDEASELITYSGD